MENTSLGFLKPTENEYYDIEIVNKNTQLANDLIEENSSAIGQKIDKGFGIGEQVVSSEVDLNKYFIGGKFVTPGTDLINLPTGWTQRRHTIDVTGGANYVTQILSADVDSANSIPKVAIRFGNNAASNLMWSKWTEIAWKETPIETVITSGFASGWSGQISYRKSQENIIVLTIIDIQKNSDILANSTETIFTLPSGFRPYRVQKTSISGLNNSAIRVNGSLVDIVLATDGTINVISVGTVTTNVRRLAGVQLLAV